MAEDNGDKSLDPTPRRRQQARERGQVAHSGDLSSAGLLLGGLVVLLFTGSALLIFWPACWLALWAASRGCKALPAAARSRSRSSANGTNCCRAWLACCCRRWDWCCCWPSGSTCCRRAFGFCPGSSHRIFRGSIPAPDCAGFFVRQRGTAGLRHFQDPRGRRRGALEPVWPPLRIDVGLGASNYRNFARLFGI